MRLAAWSRLARHWVCAVIIKPLYGLGFWFLKVRRNALKSLSAAFKNSSGFRVNSFSVLK